MYIHQLNSNEDFSRHLTREMFIDFLYRHLGQFRDSRQAIGNAVDYAFSREPGKGGFLLAAFEGETMVGALVMIHTGMKEYIPGHLLVYIAVDEAQRGKGYGRKIAEEAIRLCDGDVSLHVEYDNPAKRLYERIGFTNKYAEMRFSKK